MKHEIKIPDKLEIGPFSYKILKDDATRQYLHNVGKLGEHDTMEVTLRLCVSSNPQQVMNTFLHEIVHAVGEHYLETKLAEKQVECLANGIQQVLKQLGIGFSD